MKYKVADLEGTALDAAVAICEGWQWINDANWQQPIRIAMGGDETAAGLAWQMAPFPWSSDWRHGGPIIERERIAILPYAHEDECEYDGDSVRLIAPGRWWAEVMQPDEGGWIERCPEHDEYGQGNGKVGATPLIAAMRAFVVSRLGEEVELP